MAFSDNQKISSRQVRGLLILDCFGLSSLLLPHFLAVYAGRDGVFSLLAGMGLAWLFICLLDRLLKREKRDYASVMEGGVGKTGEKIFLSCYLIVFLWLAAFTLYLIINLIRSQLLNENYVWIILLLLLAFGAYGTLRGIEGRARIFEVLFWFLAVPLIFILCLALRDVNADYWVPIADGSLKGFLMGVYISFAGFLPVSLMVFVRPYCRKPDALTRQAKISVLAVGGVDLFIYLILLGIFQVNALAALRRPVVTLMTMINLPGGFLERQDAFMTAIWFFSLFAFYNTMFYYARSGCEKLWKKRKVGYRYLLLVLPALLAGAVWFVQAPRSEEIFYRILLFTIVPFVILAPFFLYGMCRLRGENGGEREKKNRIPEKAAKAGRPAKTGKARKKAGMILGALFLCVIMNGCGVKELEERAFVLAIGVGESDGQTAVAFAYPDVTGQDAKDDALMQDLIWQAETENFYDAQKRFERESNLSVDYNHMKALLISAAYASDEKQLTALTQLLANSEELPRNMLLFLTEGRVDQVITKNADINRCLGIYLEQMTDSSMELKSRATVTLGTLMNQAENQNETILIPILSMEENKPVVASYGVFDKMSLSGTISTQEALLAFLANNGLKNVSWETKDGKIFELSGIKSSRTLEQSGGDTEQNPEGWLLHIQLSVQANLINDFLRTTEEKEDMKDALEEEIKSDILSFLREKREEGMDLTNSYLQLPGLCREGWEQIRPDKAAYERALDYDMDVDVHILNEDF